MKIAVVGSRDFPDLDMVRDYVRALPRTTTVITGGAVGVDQVAEDTAQEFRLSRLICEPQCPKGSPREAYVAALMARNERIVRAADLVIIFWDGESPGSQRVREMAERMGKPFEVRLPRGKAT